MSYTLQKLSNRYQRMHNLIQTKATGNAQDFARKLEISESTLFSSLKFIKDQGIKLGYDTLKQTYFYEEDQPIRFSCGFEKEIK